MNPTRARLLEILMRMGLQISVAHLEEHQGELLGTIEARGTEWKGGIIAGADTAALIDEIPVLAAIPAHEDIRRKSANYEIVGKPGESWAPLFETLAAAVAEAPPRRPKPLNHDALLGLFKGDAVGRNVVLEPATSEDMCGGVVIEKPSLEVVYEAI